MKSLTLTQHTTIKLKPEPPFNFDATMHKPDHFPSRDNAWEPGIKWQTMVWPSYAEATEGKPDCLGLKFENKGTINNPKIKLSVWSQKKHSEDLLNSLVSEMRYRYSLNLDLTDFNRKFKDDPQLGPVIKRWKGMRPMHYSSLYEHLIIMIVLQNCTVRRSVDMLQALFENYGTLLRYNGKELWSYWRPEDLNSISEEKLRHLKLGYRARFIKRISEQFAKREIDEFELRKMSKEEQREKLLGLYGIGPASVHNLLWEVFKHYNELEKISSWEQKIYSKLFFNRSPEEPVLEEKLLKHFDDRFSKYKMLAIHYIWEDLWWKRKSGEGSKWLGRLIRL